MIKNKNNKRIFLILLGACLVGVACVFPYVLTVQGDVIKSLGISVEQIVIAQLIQSTILFSITIILGLKLSQNNGFKTPLLSAIVEKRDYKKEVAKFFKLSVILGIIIALAIYGLDVVFASLGTGISTHVSIAPAWQKLLAATYGGIVEEVIMRLFLMSLLVWLGTKILRMKQPNQGVIWVAILMAAVIFGLGHLPITAAITQINAIVITRAIVLNGIGGVVFGWLLWKKGLESAMLSHFTTDIVLLTLLPILFG